MFLFRRTPLLILASSLLVGCDSYQGTARFVPSESSAKDSLEAALNSWKSGQKKPAGIKDHKPPIEILDSKWDGGQKLTNYEILGEDVNADGHHRFKVKLTVNPGGTVETYYVVYGQDPIWVAREEDYKKMTGM